MNTKPIQEYIIQSEENLRIAEAVAAALPEARQKMANAFITRLEGRLKSTLTGWKFSSRDVTFFRDGWTNYTFWKQPWAGQYMLALEFGNYGQTIVFGVRRDKDKIGNRPFCDELLNAIQQEISSAKHEEWWWEARIPMESPASNWLRSDILWRMHKDENGEFLKDVADQLLGLAKISEPIIDALVSKYTK